MCLRKDEALTEQVKSEGTRTAWKVMKLVDDDLYSMCQHQLYRPGWNYPDTSSPDWYPPLWSYEVGLHGGCLHVFLDEQRALDLARQCGLRVLPVRCEPEDLVAAGPGYDDRSRTAAYTRLWVEESDYQAALKEEAACA